MRPFSTEMRKLSICFCESNLVGVLSATSSTLFIIFFVRQLFYGLVICVLVCVCGSISVISHVLQLLKNGVRHMRWWSIAPMNELEKLNCTKEGFWRQAEERAGHHCIGYIPIREKTHVHHYWSQDFLHSRISALASYCKFGLLRYSSYLAHSLNPPYKTAVLAIFCTLSRVLLL